MAPREESTMRHIANALLLVGMLWASSSSSGCSTCTGRSSTRAGQQAASLGTGGAGTGTGGESKDDKK
jgi:hypothetical protein